MYAEYYYIKLLKMPLSNGNIQLSYVYIYVSAKNLPFTHFYIILHTMQLFVTPFSLKSAKLTKKRLKVMECAARNYLNIRNTLRFKILTANFSLILGV